MIDQNLLRNDPTYVEEMLKRRNVTIQASEFLNMDRERKMIQVQTEDLQAQRNRLAKEIGILKAKGKLISSESPFVLNSFDQINAQLSYEMLAYAI